MRREPIVIRRRLLPAIIGGAFNAFANHQARQKRDAELLDLMRQVDAINAAKPKESGGTVPAVSCGTE